MALFNVNKAVASALLDVSSSNTTKVAGRGGTFTGAVVGKHYLVYQTDYTTEDMGDFTGATIITSNAITGDPSSTTFRVCVIEATDTSIVTFVNATGNTNYENSWFIPID